MRLGSHSLRDGLELRQSDIEVRSRKVVEDRKINRCIGVRVPRSGKAFSVLREGLVGPLHTKVSPKGILNFHVFVQESSPEYAAGIL